ncbi:MAG: hybrid sensor histidine kinase/response regulator, partial [Sphingobacteriaceae bacterium]
FFLLWMMLGCQLVNAQYLIKADLLQPVSVSSFATIADAETVDYQIDQIRNNKTQLKFKKIDGKFASLGFTNHNFWLKIAFKNSIQVPVFYYLETAEPVTNQVNLYLVDGKGNIDIQQSGDELDFAKRTLPFRKTVFKLQLNPNETKQAFIEINNDGEKNSMPLKLISQQCFLQATYSQQFSMGIFYGLLFVIAVTYCFFYFALIELSFLYYSLYVTFTGFCQFALDGFYHQYLGESNNWFNLHFVIITAILGCYFFGKYSELILEVKRNHPTIKKLFKSLYVLLGLVLFGVIVIPQFLQFSYPIINVLTLAGMLLIFTCVFLSIYRKQNIDLFYTSGILILFLCILGAILMNFGVFPDHMSIDNITKPGIGLEVIALSLSMANRIRLLKTKKEELQTIALQKAQEMNDLKSYFLSNMSHELRTPLNAIIGLASVTEMETADLTVKANCGIIKDTSYGLISSVNDILDFSRIERDQLKLDNKEFNP